MNNREKQQRRDFVISQIEAIRKDQTKSNARALREIKEYKEELSWLTK